MLPSQQTLREEDHRHAITEILFFASIGDVARMKALSQKFNVCVSACSSTAPSPPFFPSLLFRGDTQMSVIIDAFSGQFYFSIRLSLGVLN